MADNKTKFSIFKLASASATPSGNPDFEADINPEKFSFTESIAIATPQTPTAGANPAQSQGAEPSSLSVELMFDGTGIAGPVVNVDDKIKVLTDLIIKVNGDKHEPNNLVVAYGKFGLKCKLQSYTLEYQLFKPNGDALRAKINMTFKGVLDVAYAVRNFNFQSPDMTHLKLIRVGDTLPSMCYSVYNNHEYYIPVAQANNIINFRNIEMGESILLPPLEK